MEEALAGSPSPIHPEADDVGEVVVGIGQAKDRAERALARHPLGDALGLWAERNRLWSTIGARLGMIEGRVNDGSIGEADLRAISHVVLAITKMSEPRQASLHEVWAIADELDVLLIQTADVDSMAALLSREVELEAAAHDGHRTDPQPWRRYLEPEVLTRLDEPFAAYLATDPTSPERSAARQAAEAAMGPARAALLQVNEERAMSGRLWRQRTETRRRNLLSALLFLAPLVILLAILMAKGTTLTSWDVAITALTGALAGTLARMFKLRDVLTITELRNLYADFFVQPFVGATIALFVQALLFSGIVQLPGATPISWATYATYGFVAAFSEPFFLKLVGRVGEAGDPHPPAQRSRGEGRGAG
jgi:hypothetical protein